MNNSLNEYLRFNFELNIELNHFLAQFNVKMNNQNVSATPTCTRVQRPKAAKTLVVPKVGLALQFQKQALFGKLFCFSWEKSNILDLFWLMSFRGNIYMMHNMRVAVSCMPGQASLTSAISNPYQLHSMKARSQPCCTHVHYHRDST